MIKSTIDFKSYSFPYDTLYANKAIDQSLRVIDQLQGFDINLKNPVLDHIHNCVDKPTTVLVDYVFDSTVKTHYPLLNFKWQNTWVNDCFKNYTVHPDIDFKNFICSFNGSAHVSRKLLVSIIDKFGWFDSKYVSKNFIYDIDIIDGHIQDYSTDEQNQFRRKFFINVDRQDFYNSINSFGHVRFDHTRNIYNLENKLTESFLHVVSETMATSYYPFVTEKFLYSVITRGLFLAYAQPGWHEHLEKYYGFRKYTKLFDYRFDNIENPVERLVELMSMISKFSVLSTDDWQDLYLIQKDEIEYNYDHYFSGNYLTHLRQYA
jgi:hypothetical protein